VRHLLAAALLLAPALHAAGPADETNSVWLVTINNSGQTLREFTLDYGTGKFYYQFIQNGLTYGGYAKIKREQPVSVRYTDGSGAKKERSDLRPLRPSMIGGILRLTFEKGGAVSVEYSRPSSEAPGTGVATYVPGMGIPDWAESGVVALLGGAALLIMAWLARRAWRLGGAIRELFKDRYLERLKGPLNLEYVVCPIPMYSNGSSRPDYWWQGSYRGRMIGLLDGTRLWLGGVDERARCAFKRDRRGVFGYEDYNEGEEVPGTKSPEFTRNLERLSPAVGGVGVLTVALEVELVRGGSPDALLSEDLPRLDAMLAKLGPPPPPIVDAYVEKLKGPLGLELVACPVPMLSLSDADPVPWWQGRYKGRMIGFYGRRGLWLGDVDEETRRYFERDTHGVFQRHETRRQSVPGADGRWFQAELDRLSPAVASVGVLTVALQISLGSAGGPDSLLREDLPRLDAMLQAVASAQEA
jgi:hypothetical protein